MKPNRFLFLCLIFILLISSSFANIEFIANFTEVDPIYTAWDKDYDDLTNTPDLDNLDNYYNKSVSNSTGFIGLTCANGKIAEFQGGVWACGTDSTGLSAIYSGNDLAYITGGDTVNVNQSALSDVYVPYTSQTGDLLMDDYTINYNHINLSNQEITYVPIDGDIEDYIDDADNGDILILSTGTYTLTSTVRIRNQVTIIGQGVKKTTIRGTNLAEGLFYSTISNITIAKVTLDTTSSTTYAGILFSGRFGDVLENMNIIDVDITASVSSATSRIVNYIDAEGTIENVNINAVSTAGRNWGLLIEGQATMEKEPYIYINNVNVDTTGVTAGNYALMFWDNGNSQYMRGTIYNSRFTSYGG